MSRTRGLSTGRALALAFFILAGTAGPAAAAPFAEGSASSDVVVLLDTSQSVLPWFHDITDYVVSSVVRDFLRIGDTFHLLSFGDTAQVEIAQRVSEEKDVRSILGRLYLLYPLARNTDLVSAFSYLYQYLADLPESRSKTVVIITDGSFNPAKGSASAALSPEEAAARVTETATKIRSQGWPVYIIKVPFTADRAAAESPDGKAAGAKSAPSSAGASGQAGAAGQAGGPGQAGATAQGGGQEAAGAPILDAMAKALDAPVTDYQPDGKEETARKSLALPEASFPADLGKKGYAFSFPLGIRNDSGNAVALELDHVVSEGQDLLQKKSFLSLGPGKAGTMDVNVALPSDTQEGAKKLTVDLYFADGIRVSPSRGVLAFELAPNPLARFFRSGSRVILFLILLATGLALVLSAVLFLLRRAPRQTSLPIVRAVRDSAEAEAEARRRKAGTSPEAAGAGEAAPSTTPAEAAATVAAAKPSTAARPGAAGPVASGPGAAIGKAGAAVPAAAGLAAAGTSQAAPSAAGLRPSAAQPAAAGPLPELASTARPAAPGTAIQAGGGASPQAARQGSAEPAPALVRPSIGLQAGARDASKDDRREGMPLKEKKVAPGQRSLKTGKRAHAETAESSEAPAYTTRVVRPGIMQVELRVEGQNPAVGLRNVHKVQAGSSRSVGGGRSDFLVFLAPMPAHAAEIHFDGERCIFVPRKPEYFPELEGPVEDCLHRDIPMLARNGRRLVLRFHRYVAPKDRINRLLHSIESPGLYEQQEE